MRALVVQGQTARLIADHPAPQMSEHDALLSPIRVCVETADRLAMRRQRDERRVPGSAFVAHVIGVHDSPNDPLVGRRVVVNPVVACGRCDLCRAGLSAHCRDRRVIGLDTDGALAERCLAPVRNLIEIPDDLDHDRAAMTSIVASAIQAQRMLTIEGRPYITVLGDTLRGFITAQLMTKLNATVRLIGWSADRLALAERWGVKHRHADDIGRRSDQDVVVECTGRVESLMLALALVRPQGRIVLQLPTSEPFSPEMTHRLVASELRLIGASHGPLQDAVKAILQQQVDLSNLVGRPLSLSDGAAIMDPRSDDGRGVLVDPAEKGDRVTGSTTHS